MPVALEEFVKQLADSGVIAPGKLENFVPPKAQPKDAQELARQLVQSKHLSKFQAQEIYAGRAKSLILGNYTIVDKIGAGGMGQVFKAEHRRMHRIVAIKTLPPAVTKDPLAVARFQREVEAAARLRHTNIVAADDADEAGGVHFLVMECVDGSDFSVLVKKNGPIPVAKAVSYILQAARGLEYAHGEGVVHRDIKPANLLLDKKGTVKILDMGLARISASDDAATRAELTGTGAVLGTVDYMPPEQALSTKHADARADIYSLGCSLHYLIAGGPIYDGDSLMAKLLAHREQPIPSLGGGVAAGIQAVFEKMVAKEVGDRYQTMGEVVAALEQCSAASQSSVGASPEAAASSRVEPSVILKTSATLTSQTAPNTKLSLPKFAFPKIAFGNRNTQIAVIAGGAFLSAAILAAVLFRMRTKDGTLVVELAEPDATVEVLDAAGEVRINRPHEKGKINIAVDPGKHRLKVEKDGFKFFAQDFEVESGGTKSIKASLVQNENKPWFKPAFLEWQRQVAAMPAEKQVDAVAKKMQELNPGLVWRLGEEPKIENGVVTRFLFDGSQAADISPVRALTGLEQLGCSCTCDHVIDGKSDSKLTDLSPLKGMRLTLLHCTCTAVSDLSPIRGMPLTTLQVGGTQISDLSPLQGMPLTMLACNGTNVSDLSPLSGINLTVLYVTPKRIVKGIDAIRGMTSLQNINTDGGYNWSREEFLQKYDAGEFGKPASDAPTLDRTSGSTLNDSAFQQWVKDVAALPAEQQIDAVAKKLQILNPGFDGKLTDYASNSAPTIENGAVTKLGFENDVVVDISPLRALTGLRYLHCSGSEPHAGVDSDSKLSDLSPLRGLSLRGLDCSLTRVSDLSPLAGMPLAELNCSQSLVNDLSQLQGMPLTTLYCDATRISDLSPLSGMPLRRLSCGNTAVSSLAPLPKMPLIYLELGGTQVTDLSPLAGMPLSQLMCDRTHVADLSPLRELELKSFAFTPTNKFKGLDAIRQMKSVDQVGPSRDALMCAGEFWNKFDAGEFKLWMDRPGFQQWLNETSSLEPEKQVDAVTAKLREFNPGFGGIKSRDIENGIVTGLNIDTEYVTDLSPVRAFAGLKCLICVGQPWYGGGKLADLSPLRGMQLSMLNTGNNNLYDLAPLQGMPLSLLGCGKTAVADLSPLKGMQLTTLYCNYNNVSDLSPLEGMPLQSLYCEGTLVSDLTPLGGTNLTELCFTPMNIAAGLDVVRQINSLQKIKDRWTADWIGPDEFWKKYDADEFGKPAPPKSKLR